MPLYPYTHYSGLTVVPYFFADDLYISSKKKGTVSEYLAQDGLKVFDFHPIHVYLNTANPSHYEKADTVLEDFTLLRSHVNKRSFGVRDFLLELIEEGQARGFEFSTISGLGKII